LFDPLITSITTSQLIEFKRSQAQAPSSLAAKITGGVKSAIVTVYAGKEIGSGSIIRADGLVITNHHVVQNAINHPGGEWLSIQTFDGTRYTGNVIGSDRTNDLALIQLVTHKKFPTVPMASRKSAQPGQKVWAIGSPFGFPGVLTEGILTVVKPNGDLQSTVILKPGNSGGPLLNLGGELIGINKAILQFPAGQNSGNSLATSVEVARRMIEHNHPGAIATLSPKPLVPGSTSTRRGQAPQPLRRDRPALPGQPFVMESNLTLKQSSGGSRELLGLIVDRNHLIVRRVQSGSLSALSGFKPGDRLVAVNGDCLNQFEELEAFLNQKPRSAVFTISRNWQQATLEVNF
jgi:serine protease Do